MPKEFQFAFQLQEIHVLLFGVRYLPSEEEVRIDIKPGSYMRNTPRVG
jgi:hypothetical protein